MKKTKKAPKKYKKRTLTSRQIKAKKNIIENHSTQGQALKDAGYSDAYASNPHEFNNTQAGQDLLEVIDAEVDAALEEAKKKRGNASYSDCIRAADTMRKLSRLESGQSTDIISIEDLIRDRKQLKKKED